VKRESNYRDDPMNEGTPNVTLISRDWGAREGRESTLCNAVRSVRDYSIDNNLLLCWSLIAKNILSMLCSVQYEHIGAILRRCARHTLRATALVKYPARDVRGNDANQSTA
jgi:hypothetical protein